jgi:hypothetical protein
MTHWSRVIVWLPLGALLVFRLVLVALSVAGQPPFWTTEPLTLSEAAAFRDGGEVARMLATGLDPNASYPVRRGAVRGRVEATPLEAAEAARRGEVVQLLREAGAVR